MFKIESMQTMKLEQDNENLKQEREAVERERTMLKQDNEALKLQKAELESQLAAVHKRRNNALTAPENSELTGGKSAQTAYVADQIPNDIFATPMSVQTTCSDDCASTIMAVVAAVEDLERHVSIVCQRSEQQNNGARALQEIQVYLQQLGKKVSSGKLRTTHKVSSTLHHLSKRIRWAQV
jgi:hypothetical protein